MTLLGGLIIIYSVIFDKVKKLKQQLKIYLQKQHAKCMPFVSRIYCDLYAHDTNTRYLKGNFRSMI